MLHRLARPTPYKETNRLRRGSLIVIKKSAHFGHFCDFNGVFLGLTGSFTLTNGAIMHYEAKAAYKQAARAMRKANAIARKRSADRLGRASVSLAMF
jgi:hypothetical protein